MLLAWRLVKARLAAQAFDGEGARRYGGRWNSPGIPIVYASGALSLAFLEVLVHLPARILRAYVSIRIEFDERLVTSVPTRQLPPGWRAYPPPPGVQQIGNDWYASRRSVVLRVPSAIVPVEHNYLINPEHQDFASLRIGDPQPFDFDPRLRDR